MKVFLEKIKIIIALFRDDEYAFYSVNKRTYKTGKAFGACYISDNISNITLSSIIEYTTICKNQFFGSKKFFRSNNNIITENNESKN